MQVKEPLTKSQKQELKDLGVTILEYVTPEVICWPKLINKLLAGGFVL